MPSSHDALLEALAAKNFAAVQQCAEELIAHDPCQPLVWQSLGVAQLRQNQAEGAVQSLERAIELGGDGAELRFELAAALEQCDRIQDAVAHLERATALDPQSFQAHANLAAILEKLDRTNEALGMAQRSIALSPNQPIAHYNLGKILQSLGNFEEAIAAFGKALELDPQFALAYATRGCCRLLLEQYATGWPDYEWRLRTGQIRLTRFPQPLWSGQPLETGTLLVHAEQGIGDEILFASCLPELITRVGKCVFVCHPRLARLMARSFPAVTVMAHAPAADRVPPKLPLAADFQIPSGSLPLHLRPTAESFPKRKRFLIADPEKRCAWRKRFDALGAGLKIGISWRGGGTSEERRRRITTLQQWRGVLQSEGAQFINLQYGDIAAELSNENSLGNQRLHDLPGADPLGNLDEFAAKIAALDLVVSIGNATVHLAGALGVPTWSLVPFVPQWRWRFHGEQMPWYPSVKILRQAQPGDWDSVLADVAAKLQVDLTARQAVGSSKPESRIIAKASLQLPVQSTVQPAVATAAAPPAKPRLICVESVPNPLSKVQSKPAVKPAAVRINLADEESNAGQSAKPSARNTADRIPSGKTNKTLLDKAIQRFNANEYAEADQLAVQILAGNPHEIVALRIRGVAARKAHELDRSIELLNRAFELSPKNAILCFELGVTYLEMNRHKDAYDSLLRAVEINPSFQPACVNICAILELQERFEEALVWARRAVELKPDCGLANYNLANQLRECGHVAPAIKHYERAVELRPDYPKAKWNLGIAYVLLGHFERAWPLFELRGVAEDVKFDLYTQPRWEGSPLAGKTIVVHAEQGIGDEVLFASCFPDLIAQAGKVILVCEPRLEKLFARSFPQAKVCGWVRRKDWQPMPQAEPIDFQIPAGSLPLYFRRSAESFPQRETFLTPDSAEIEQWRQRFATLGPEIKVGISWRAGGKANEGRKRTISLLDWREMLSTPNVHFVNLQYGDTVEDIADVKRELGVTVHDWEQGDPLVDMDGYASKIAALDLVISVGNAAVHLAGSVGTPAWTLLPRVPSWRWMVSGEVSPWYSSVRLFRQPRRCNWDPVLQQVAERLREVAAPGDSTENFLEDRTSGQMRRRIRAVMPKNEPPEAVPLDAAPAAASNRWMQHEELPCRKPLDVMSALDAQADAALKAGDLAEAERCYREILQITPRHMKAHAGLGLIARAQGRFDAAVRGLQRALNLYEPHATNHAYLAATLLELGRPDEALVHAQRAVELEPVLPEANRELGRALQASGNHLAAIKSLRIAQTKMPRDAATIAALGRSLSATGKIDAALDLLRQSIQKDPEQPGLHLALGETLLEDQCFSEAEQCFKHAQRIKPTNGEANYFLAKLFQQQNRLDEAEAALRQTLADQPQSLPAMLDLAALLRRMNRPSEAEPLYRRALELHADSPELINLLGTTILEQGLLEQAIAQYDRALQLRPDFASAHANRALAQLQLGDFANGWNEYEWRWSAGEVPRSAATSIPQWDGLPLASRTIVVYGEQGVGDEIMFATCYPDLIRQARRVAIVCEPRLERLLRRSFPEAIVLAIPQGCEKTWQLPPQLAVDVQCPTGSLPRWLRRSEADFPKQNRLLQADPASTKAWNEQFSALGSGVKIGISWRTSEAALGQDRRGTQLEQWKSLLELPEIQWINLQAGDCRQELAQFPASGKSTIHDWPEKNQHYDLNGLAAKIAALDLVVTVDNTLAHLAAAVGTPTWILLPQPANWRWLRVRSDSPWYGSVRLFRQCRMGQWGEVFRDVRQELLKRQFRLDEQTEIGPHAPHWSQIAKVRR